MKMTTTGVSSSFSGYSR